VIFDNECTTAKCAQRKKRKLNSMAPLLLSLNLKWRPLNLKATATATNKVTEVPLPEKIRNSRILVLGGTGRVGGSTAIALSNFCPDLQILVAGRNRSVTVPVHHTHPHAPPLKSCLRVFLIRVSGRKVRLSPLNLEEMQSLFVLTSTT